MLGWTDLDGVGFVVSEISPYEADLDWSELTEPDEIGPVVEYLGRATAKVHCVADSDADHSLVDFQTEDAITRVVAGREDEFVAWVVDFAHTYAAQVREDHALFVDAFREGRVPGVSASG
jgi:uncharacterized protein (DUF2252 family)